MDLSRISAASPGLISGISYVPLVVSTPPRPRVQVDRLYGALIGFVLGDALGAPHNSSTLQYTGLLSHRFSISAIDREKDGLMGVGQVTSNTEMMLTLFRSILSNGGWNYASVVEAYATWGASQCLSRSYLTRQLFDSHGSSVISVRTYEGRYEKMFGKPYHGSSFPSRDQSNSSLARSLPLALVDDPYVEQDITLTHPNYINIELSQCYVRLLKMALRGELPQQLWNELLNSRSCVIKYIVSAVSGGDNWNLVSTELGEAEAETKGWCVFSFYVVVCLIHGLSQDPSLSLTRCMEWIIRDHPGSDTNTNAAVMGAMAGAIMGASKILSDPIMRENYEKITSPMTTDFPRPRQYQPHDLSSLAEAGAALASRYPPRT